MEIQSTDKCDENIRENNENVDRISFEHHIIVEIQS